MTTIRDLSLDDLFTFNRVVLDTLTAVYPLSYYINRIVGFPELAKVAIAPNGEMVGFVFGHRVSKEDGKVLAPMVTPPKDIRGHVCCLSIEHDFRRLGIARTLMHRFNESLERHKDWFVALYVRCKNSSAIKLYESMGFMVSQWYPNFYDDDHGYEMRMPLARDADRTCLESEDFFIDNLINFAEQLFQLLQKYWKQLRNAIGFLKWH